MCPTRIFSFTKYMRNAWLNNLVNKRWGVKERIVSSAGGVRAYIFVTDLVMNSFTLNPLLTDLD